VQAPIGGQTAAPVIQGEKLFDSMMRMEPQFRWGARAIRNLRVTAPAGQQIPLTKFATIRDGERRVSHLSGENFGRGLRERGLDGLCPVRQSWIASGDTVIPALPTSS
jgi:Cu/Ag efflux pump CusA